MPEQEEDAALDAALAQVEGWATDWARTPGYEALTPGQRELAEQVLAAFVEAMYSDHGQAPGEWAQAEARACCLETLPATTPEGPPFFLALAPVLCAFLDYVARSGKLPRAAGLAKTVRPLGPRIVQAASDPRNWSLSKSLAMGASGGQGRLDGRALNALMSQKTEQAAAIAGLPSAPVYGSGAGHASAPPAPGPVSRNAPCPCGSGLKYKKCCGPRPPA